MKKNKWIAPIMAVVAITLIVGLGGFFVVKAFSGGSPKVVVKGNATINVAGDSISEASIGASTEHYVAERFAVGFARKTLVSSTAGSAATILESELADYDIFEMLVTAQNSTLTLPATSTLSSILRDPGDSRTWIIRSMTTGTAAVLPTLTVAKGTGWDLLGDDANVDVILPNETLQMDCFRQTASSTNPTSSDIVCGLHELINVD